MNLLVSGELYNYLQKFDGKVNRMYSYLVEEYKVRWNGTEKLKYKINRDGCRK